jgi:hypothetical protein
MSFDEEARLSAEALGTHLSREIQDRLQEFIGRLVDAAEQDRQAAAERAEQAVSTSLQEQREASERAMQELRVAQDRADQALAAAAQERQTLADQAQQALAAAEQTLQEAVSRAREEAMHEATSRFEAQLADRTSRFESDHMSRLDADHAERMTRLNAQHDERMARLDAELAERVTRLEAEHAARFVRAEADRADRDAALEREAIERQTAERETMVAGMQRLVSGFRRLDEGQSLSQLLDTLAMQAAAEASRCALFVVRGRTLQGWSLSGFDNAPREARSLTIKLDVLPELARVVSQGQRADVQTAAFASEEAEAVAFMNHPSVDSGVAVPVTVGGQVAALIYVDDGGREDRPVPASWPEAIELLARHAGRCLEAQTAIRAARLSGPATTATSASAAPQQPLRAVSSATAAPQQVQVPVATVTAPSDDAPTAPMLVASTPMPTLPVVTPITTASATTAPAGMNDAYAEEHARRYARLLIADIRLYNEAAVRTGREQRDLASRLQPEIARARSAFEERIPASVRNRERFFDEELVRTLADGDETLLGVDERGSHPESLAV